MKLGQKVILRVIEIVEKSDYDDDKKLKILNLINPFLTNTEEIDLMTICKLEIITGHKILYVPNKQQLRRIKIERLNEIINENKNE